MMLTGGNRTDQNLTKINKECKMAELPRSQMFHFYFLTFYLINILHVIVLMSHPCTKKEKSMIRINIDSRTRFYISKTAS